MIQQRILPLLFVIGLVNCPTANSQEFDLSSYQPAQIKSLALVPTNQRDLELPISLYPKANESYDRNAAIYYHRAIYQYRMTEASLERNNSAEGGTRSRLQGNDELWIDSPISEMPIDDVRAWLNHHTATWREIGYAVRSSNCDWQLLPEEERANFYAQLIPEIHECRELARFLTCKARVQIADGQFEAATETIKACYKLAHDINESRIVVGTLVGVACVAWMNQPIEELMQRSNRSFYWPIKTLPKLIDIRRASRHEIELHHFAKGFQDVLNLDVSDPGAFQRTKAYFVLTTIAPAKQWLMDRGMSKPELEAMRSEDVVELAFRRLTDVLNDQQLKTLTFDYPDLEAANRKFTEHTVRLNFVNENSISINLLPVMVPYFYLSAVTSANSYGFLIRAEATVERQFAAFQVMEAIRFHLHEHGSFPANLGEITNVPIPLNPETGKPFRYQSKGKQATLISDSAILQSTKVYQLSIANLEE